jgi:hypothetical protein
MTEAEAKAATSQCFSLGRLDTSEMVGRSVVLFTEQFPGRMLKSRVLSAASGQVELDSGARFAAIENLVNHQEVVLQFVYRGQEISVKSQLRRSAGGRCFLQMDGQVLPLSQRRFHRAHISVPVRLAAYPQVSFRRTDLSRLRWIKTDTINISSGGSLLEVPSLLQADVLLMLNLDLERIPLPQLLLGRVRHCFATDTQAFHAGVEFVVRDDARRLFSPSRRRELPTAIFNYSRADREVLNRRIKELDTRHYRTQIHE